jgi:hypothetical protein
MTALVTALAVMSSRADAAKRARCPDGSYVVVGQRLITGDPAAAPADMLSIVGRKVSIESGCPPRRGTVKGTRKGTKVQASWPRCGQRRRVVLKALIDTACRNVTGTVKWKGSGPQSFRGFDVSSVTTTTVTSTTAPTVTTTTLGTSACTNATLAQLEQVVASGGTLTFCPGTSILLEKTLVVDGVDVTLRGPATLSRDFSAPAFRLFEVRGGSLTLEMVFLRNGRVIGTNGGNGQNGQNGDGGMQGANHDNEPGVAGEPGMKGQDATEASAGEDGGMALGGGILVHAGATVTLRDSTLDLNGAVGGRGGDGGAGGRGGGGGAGGRGGGGPDAVGGNGGSGGNGGNSTEGKNGGNGGEARGGGIHNSGTLTIERCRFMANFAQAGLAGRGGAGATGGAGGGGNFGGSSFDGPAMGDGTKKGGDGGSGIGGLVGWRGGDGGSGGNAFGGAIYNQGTLVVSDTEFNGNFATATDGSYGASAGAGGGGGSGGNGGGGKPGGKGGNGGGGGNGANGGSNGNGGDTGGGAIFSTNQPALTNVTFRKKNDGTPSNTASAGTGGVDNCTPGDFSCFGAGGPGGLGGSKGSGGASVPLGSEPGADGLPGSDGNPGVDGQAGTPGFASDPECSVAGASCS